MYAAPCLLRVEIPGKHVSAVTCGFMLDEVIPHVKEIQSSPLIPIPVIANVEFLITKILARCSYFHAVYGSESHVE